MLNHTTSINNSIQSQPQSAASTPNATKGLKVDVPKDSRIQQNIQNQPQVHQTCSKPRTSSSTSASDTTTNNKSIAPSNSDLISAVPTPSTFPTTAAASGSSAVIPGGSEGNEGKSGESQSANKSLGNDPCTSSSCSTTTILPTVHTSVKAKTEKCASVGGDDANNAGSKSNNFDGITHQSSATGSDSSTNVSSKRSKQLRSTPSNSSTVSGESPHVSFDKSADLGRGESFSSVGKKGKMPSTSSSGGKCRKEKPVGGTTGELVKSAAVDITIPKIDKDDTIAKRREKDVVLPGKVVKLESPSETSTLQS